MNEGFWQQVFLKETVQSWALFLGILLFGFLVLRPLSKWTASWAAKMGKNNHSDSQVLLQKLRKPISNLLLTIICFIAFHQLKHIPQIELLHFANVKGLEEGVALSQLVDHLFQLIVIIFVALIAQRFSEFLLHEMQHRNQTETNDTKNQLYPFLQKLIKFLIWMIATFIILGGVLHMNVPALIASLGIGGVAIALAAKETVENTLASVLILVDKPFQIGDSVKLGTVEGQIEHIGFRSSRIRSASQSLIIVPNKKLVDETVENLTERGKQRLSADFTLPLDTPKETLDLVLNTIKTSLENHEKILDPIAVYFSSIANYALQIRVGYFVVQPMAVQELNQVKQDINSMVLHVVNEQAGGFAVPVSQSIVAK